MWRNLHFFGAGRRSRCATTKPIRFATNFDEEGPLRRRATRGVAPPPSTILPRLTVTEQRDFEKLTFVPKPYRRTLRPAKTKSRPCSGEKYPKSSSIFGAETPFSHFCRAPRSAGRRGAPGGGLGQDGDPYHIRAPHGARLRVTTCWRELRCVA